MRRPTASTRRWPRSAAGRAIGSRARSGCAATPPTSFRSWSPRDVTPDVLTDQTSAHDALNGYVPNGLSLDEANRLRDRDPQDYVARSMAAMAGHVRAMLDAQGPGRRHLRLRQQHPRPGADRPASPTPSTSRASCPSTSVRCSAKARDRSAGWRCPAIPKTFARPIRPCSKCFPTTSRWCAGFAWRANRSHFQGLPARICWLGYGERARFGLRINEMVRDGRTEGADRDRPRPSRRRIGRLAQPRDRRHEGRQRRDRRLADAQRAAQRGVRRHLGVGAPRRRRRHRLFAARRHGDRRGRHDRRRRDDSNGC